MICLHSNNYSSSDSVSLGVCHGEGGGQRTNVKRQFPSTIWNKTQVSSLPASAFTLGVISLALTIPFKAGSPPKLVLWFINEAVEQAPATLLLCPIWIWN